MIATLILLSRASLWTCSMLQSTLGTSYTVPEFPQTWKFITRQVTRVEE